MASSSYFPVDAGERERLLDEEGNAVDSVDSSLNALKTSRDEEQGSLTTNLPCYVDVERSPSESDTESVVNPGALSFEEGTCKD